MQDGYRERTRERGGLRKGRPSAACSSTRWGDPQVPQPAQLGGRKYGMPHAACCHCPQTVVPQLSPDVHSLEACASGRVTCGTLTVFRREGGGMCLACSHPPQSRIEMSGLQPSATEPY
eukprot:19370-Chlamydomonas_euryale.AAC.6